MLERQTALKWQHQQACGTLQALQLNPIISRAPASRFKDKKRPGHYTHGKHEKIQIKKKKALMLRILLKYVFMGKQKYLSSTEI